MARKFLNVAVQLFHTQLAEFAFVRSIEHGPEAFNPAGMHVAPDVFLARAIDDFVLVETQALVDLPLIRVDGRARLHPGMDKFPGMDKSLAGVLADSTGNTRPNLLGRAILDSDHGSLASPAAPGTFQLLPLGVVLAAVETEAGNGYQR